MLGQTQRKARCPPGLRGIGKIFGIWKRSYGLRRMRMRWRGTAKAACQSHLTAIACNLKRTLDIVSQAGLPTQMTNRAEPVQTLHHPASYGLLSLLPPGQDLPQYQRQTCPRTGLITRNPLPYPSKRLLRGKPLGGRRPAAPRAARHSPMSFSVRTRPLPPPMIQLRPSSSRKVVASASAPSR